MLGSLNSTGLRGGLPRLIGEQVDCVAGMVPQQMIGPAARFAERVHVGPAEEVGLHVHLQTLQLAGFDALVDPLVTWVETPGVAGHGNQTSLGLGLGDSFRVRNTVGHRNLDLHVLAGAQTLYRLVGMHLCRGGQDSGADPGLRQTFGQVAGRVRNTDLPGDLFGLLLVAAGKRDDLYPLDLLQCFEVFDSKSALTGDDNLHKLGHVLRIPSVCSRESRAPTRYWTRARDRSDISPARRVPWRRAR